MNIILIYFARKYKGDWDKIYKAIEEKEKVALPELNALEKEIEEKGWKIITILDIDYPNKLKESYKPPFVLWTKGNEKLLDLKMFMATGDATNVKVVENINRFIPEIEKHHVLITAGLKGVDEEVAKVSKKGRVIIGAGGINKLRTNLKITENDLVLTEYSPEDIPTRDTFRNRNRLLGAFSESLILFSSQKDGPINNLITNFLNLGKEIYAFAGDGGPDDGNSELIKQGANLITGIKDVIPSYETEERSREK